MSVTPQRNQNAFFVNFVIVTLTMILWEGTVVECSEPRNFISAPTTVKALENNTVLLPCYLETITNDGIIYNRVRWYKNNQLLTDSGPPRQMPPERFTLWTNGSLQVTNVQPKDTGKYTCEIVRPSPWSTVRQIHAIEVTHPPTVEPYPANGFLQVRLGEEVRMSCLPRGTPYPMITWFHKGKEMQLLDNREMLKFMAYDRHSAGEYRCLARNGVGEPATASITLSIVYQPEVVATRSWIHTAPGVRTQMECIVSAEPQATVTWMKNQAPITYNGRIVPMVEGDKHTLLIRNATFRDFGIYICKAQNDQGQEERSIQLSGIANSAVFKYADQTDIDTRNSHRLIWEVDSYTPIIEYNLWFRSFGKEFNNKDWNKLTIPAEHSTGPMYSKAYTIKGLQEKTIYEALLLSRNRYGWSKPSTILRFATDGADLQEDVVTTIQVHISDEYFAPKPEVNGLSGGNDLWTSCYLYIYIIFYNIFIKLST